jgi:hypothetical protein
MVPLFPRPGTPRPFEKAHIAATLPNPWSLPPRFNSKGALEGPRTDEHRLIEDFQGLTLLTPIPSMNRSKTTVDIELYNDGPRIKSISEESEFVGTEVTLEPTSGSLSGPVRSDKRVCMLDLYKRLI